ncbi:hypothetical protein H8356DRAFT_1068310 [Neocallimastix lanati (nom. inval.)]|nr:hypothetical protein H8356DRAFT_1068310 [Neocallimastix sp. JGI-2020a]
MGSCTIYPVKDQSYLKKCYPHVSDGARALVQDNYNLGQGKWRLVEEFLNHEIPIVYQNTEYSPYSSLTNSFYEPTNTTVLTIDFMNIQGAANFMGIAAEAEAMNNNLSKYLDKNKKLHNHWFVLHYPTNDLVRKISDSTNLSSNTSSKTKRSESSDVVQIDGFVAYTDFDYYITSTENACLQRRIIINQQGYEEEMIKYDYKCVNNKKNKWRIISKESSRYEHLTCSSNYLKAGYKCCRNQYARVEKVDNIGNWAKENGEWCGIGYERCSFEILGHHCCSSVNPKVIKEDSYGKWGQEDGELCGIGEMNRVVLFRIRNVKTKQCILVNNSDGNLIDLGECTTSNHSLWHVTNVDEYNNKRITSDKNGKCLYAANACTSGLEVCEEIMNIKDRYMHFEFVEDKYLCVKNNRNQKYNCLSSKTLNFEETYDKNDESFQWEIQDIDNGVIIHKENDPYNPDRNNDPPKISPPSDSDCPVDDYPCCSPEITEVIYTDDKVNHLSLNIHSRIIHAVADRNTNIVDTDENGSWGFENGDWCHILSDITITTPTPTCSSKFAELGYPCCSDPNTAVVSTDATGSWGIENGDWCGISDDNTTAITTTTTTTNIPTLHFSSF